jgi:radical SAM protein with 4Fe4S-binding SPASM domain
MDLEQAHRYLVRRISPTESYQDLLSFPRFFEIETVNTCNARCPMCTIEEWTRHSPTMKDDLFEKIAAEICDHADQVRRVQLFKDGEPLLDKKLPRRIARMKDGGVKQVGISTNVSLLNERRATDILQAGLDQIILSVDSLNKEVFERIRVKLVHEEVMANAQRFIALRNKIRPSTQIWVRMIRQDANFNEWPEFEAFWKPKLADTDRVNFHNLHNWGTQLKGFKSVSPNLESELPCVALWSSMVIFADGRVPLCQVDYNNLYPSGSVKDRSIAEVWRDKALTNYRRAHLEGRKSEIHICDGCNVWEEPPDKEKIAPEFAAAGD